MLSVSEKYIRTLNTEADPLLFGQDWNDEAWAVCKSDMLIKKEDADNIRLGDTFSQDNFDRTPDGKKITFDYMLANPPFGVEWKQQERFIKLEQKQLGYQGRFGAGLPRINDGSLLFLQHMISKMRPVSEGGSRIAIVFNGSPLFTGDAGSGESNIRQWIIENDWLEAVIALPKDMFYNTGIFTYIWVLTNRKEQERKGKIQLIDARQFFVKMKKSLGNKRNKIGDIEDGEPDHIGDITRIFGNFRHNEQCTFNGNGEKKTLIVSKIFENADFGYSKIIVERPLRLNFKVTHDRIEKIKEETGFKNLAVSTKKNETVRLQEQEEGRKRQDEILAFLKLFGESTGGKLYKDRKIFLSDLRDSDRKHKIHLAAPELKAVLNALSERDESAEICRDRNGDPESDSDLRDTENVPLKENIDEYFKREVLPHVPDAWIDNKKIVIGYEIPINRHFYVYEPPRSLEVIEAEIKGLESEILGLLKEVTE